MCDRDCKCDPSGNLYGSAVDAMLAELGHAGRHEGLLRDEHLCSRITIIGPKLLGDEIERKEKVIQEKEAGFRRMEDLACKYINKLTETEGVLATANLEIERLKEQNQQLQTALGYAEDTLDTKDEGYNLIIKDLKEKLERAEVKAEQLQKQLNNERDLRAVDKAFADVQRNRLKRLEAHVDDFYLTFANGDF